MLNESSPPPESVADRRLPTRSFAKAVLLITAIVGTLDIAAAHVHSWAVSGNFPTMMFKGIAGGAVGRERAFQGGAEMLALGAFCHYFISFAFTLLFFLLRPRLAVMRKNPWAVGTAYGLLVWTLMNCVVLPLSALSSRGPNFSNPHTYIGIAVLVVLFGIPIALGADRYFRAQARPTCEA